MTSTDELTFGAEELDELRSSIRGALEKSTDVGTALDALGAEDLIEEGGVVLGILLEELGRSAKSTTVVDRVLLHALGIDDTEFSVLFPMPRRGAAAAPTATNEGDAFRIDGLIKGTPNARLLVVVESGAFSSVGVEGLTVTGIEGIEPDASWARVEGLVAASEVTSAGDGASWANLLPTVRLAVASELIGATEEIIRLAAEHVTTREQFGRPLGSFQSVRHRLAESHVDVTAARSVLDLAWRTPDDDAISIAAKAWAGRAYESAARNGVQVSGAMGLTWEYPLHRLVRFGMVRNALLGDARDLAEQIGHRILAGETIGEFDPLLWEAR